MSSTIGSEAAAGTISGADATALTSALDTIDSSLSADRTASASGGSGSKLDPSAMKDRIDGLIADQVGSGGLTSDQATELKTLFASHGRSTQAGQGTDAVGGVSGPGGPPPGPPPGPPHGASASDGSSSNSSTSSTSPSASDLLSTFMQQLQAAQSSNAGYGAGGTGSTTRASALLFDFQS